MIDQERHPADELQLLLDGRLPSGQRTLVEAHLAHCPRCRRELDALRRVKGVLRDDLPERPVPTEVAARVSAAIATEAGARVTRRGRAARLWRRGAMVGLSLAAAGAILVVLVRKGGSDSVEAAEQALASYRTATLALDLETSDPQALERFFGGRIPFATRVFDFGMMGYRLAGGKVHRIAGRQSALFAYRNAAGHPVVVCQMYQGRLSELPPGAEERQHAGIHFRIYRAAGATLVFWQEGSVVCVLATDGDPEAAVQLAYAKAIKV